MAIITQTLLLATLAQAKTLIESSAAPPKILARWKLLFGAWPSTTHQQIPQIPNFTILVPNHESRPRESTKIIFDMKSLGGSQFQRFRDLVEANDTPSQWSPVSFIDESLVGWLRLHREARRFHNGNHTLELKIPDMFQILSSPINTVVRATGGAILVPLFPTSNEQGCHFAYGYFSPDSWEDNVAYGLNSPDRPLFLRLVWGPGVQNRATVELWHSVEAETASF